MKYYIARQSNNIETGDLVIYRVVKRLRDFKAEDDVLYRVFKGRRQMDTSLTAPLYVGVDGKLKKHPDKFVLRF